MASRDPTGVLGQIMAASSKGLAVAEQHHQKAVDTARQQIKILLEKESTKLAQSIKRLGTDLAAASSILTSASDCSKKAADQAAKAPPSAGDSWNSPNSMAQAQLSTHISLAQRTLRKQDRKRNYALQDAKSKAGRLLEDGVSKLSRKVGDISDLLKEAQSKFDDIDMSVQSPQNSFVQKGEASMDLKSSLKSLQAAEAKTETSSDKVLKSMTSDFDSVEKELESGATAIDHGLVVSQEAELRRVRDATSMPAAHKKSLRAKNK
jgi:hypothetical protein